VIFIANLIVNAQILLMVGGYAHRADASYLSNLARSSIYINAISNRLAASSQRASFLGMVVGTAVSELVDPKGNRMAFSSEDINSTDGQWYRSLTGVNDAIGSIEDLQPAVLALKSSLHPTKTAVSNPKIAKQPTKLSSITKIVSIEEIVDSSDSEEEDLPTYEKPDSDEDDEDEDPTLVQRDKPIAPV
jgi:telomere length regulation protein